MRAFADGFAWTLANLGLPVSGLLLLVMATVEVGERLQVWLKTQQTRRFIAAIQASDSHDPQVRSETASGKPPEDVAVEVPLATGSLVDANRSRREDASTRLPQQDPAGVDARTRLRLPASTSVGAAAGHTAPTEPHVWQV